MQEIGVTVLVLALAASSLGNVISFANAPSGPKFPINGTKLPGHNETQFPGGNFNHSGFFPPSGPRPQGPNGDFGPFKEHDGPGGFGGFGGHGGPGMKKDCPSAVARKVGACHSKYSKGPVNVLLNIDPKVMDRMNQMLNDWEADDEEDEQKVELAKTMIKTFLQGPLGANIKKAMNAMMAFHAGKFVDKICSDLPTDKCNAAFGFGNTWYWISGTEKSHANKTVVHDLLQKNVNMSEVMSLMKVLHGGKGGRRGGKGDKSDSSESNSDESSEEDQMGPADHRGFTANITHDKPHWSNDTKGNHSSMFGDHTQGREGFMGHKGDGMREPKTNVSQNIAWALIHQALGKTIPFEANKIPKSAESAGFQIMVTMDNFDRNKFGKIDAIIDLFGRFSNDTNNAGYTNENVYIASTPEKAMSFIETIRFRICQRNGGVAKEQPPRPQRNHNETMMNDPRSSIDGKQTPKVQPVTARASSPSPSSHKPAVTPKAKVSTTRKAPIPLVGGKTTPKNNQDQHSS